MANMDKTQSTQDEKDFIKRLGEHCDYKDTETEKPSKRHLLHMYMLGCQKRTEWGNINAGEILIFTQQLIDKENNHEVKI